MEEQRKKRKDTDQDDGPEEEEVVSEINIILESSKTVWLLGTNKRESGEAVRITGKCKARTKERLEKKVNFCKIYEKCFVRFCRRFVWKVFWIHQYDFNKKESL